VALVLDIIEDIGADRIILNGDLLDFYNINAHGPKHPIVGTLLDDELSRGRMFLNDLRARFKKQEIVFLFGNHEHRLERFIIKNCKALYDIISLDKLLGLGQLKIKWYRYNSRYQIEDSNVFVQHSPPSYAKNGAMVSLERNLDVSTIYGCTHREQKAVRNGGSGNKYYCYFNGWLGSTTLSPEHAEIFSYTKGHENWQQCFSIVTIENRKDAFIEQISINNQKATYNGYVYG